MSPIPLSPKPWIHLASMGRQDKDCNRTQPRLPLSDAYAHESRGMSVIENVIKEGHHFFFLFVLYKKEHFIASVYGTEHWGRASQFTVLPSASRSLQRPLCYEDVSDPHRAVWTSLNMWWVKREGGGERSEGTAHAAVSVWDGSTRNKSVVLICLHNSPKSNKGARERQSILVY